MKAEDEIFEAAAALPAAERAAYLDAACAGRPEARAFVEGLLASHQATGFMQVHTPAARSPDPGEEQGWSQPEVPGQQIGHYTLLEPIGEGGFGIVWVADQLEPVRRQVAVKIIKPGMDSREVIARFEAERQALAMMDHPNIAKVFDAGTTELGRPYFVMELVRGLRITDFCDQANLSTAERLKLFIAVCQAVQHAHQKGIIHRDLKPSNILVTAGDDGAPAPKVIDFGVAKAIGQAVTDGTVYTQFEQMIGTPAYMSPEQAGLGPMDIDTRSDVYSLGILLYELLTGCPPFDPKELLDAGLDEMRRIIREVDPPKPSTRLTQLKLAGSNSVKNKFKLRTPHSIIDQDLDWIVMKAIEKDRARRYETANGLALDIQRFLASEPVVARPPGFSYRAGKFIRKHKGPVAAVAAVSVTMLGGFAASIVLYLREKHALGMESSQRNRAEAGEKAARIENARLQQTAKFLKEMLNGVTPENARGEDTKLLNRILDDAARRVSMELKDYPEVEASIHNMISNAYVQIGQFSKAQTHAERALAIFERILGPEAPHTLSSRAFRSRALVGQGKWAEVVAEEKARIAIESRLLGEEHRDTLGSRMDLANTLRNMGDYKAAEKEQQEVLAIRKRVLGPEALDTLLSRTNLANIMNSQGKFLEAEAEYRAIIAVYDGVLGGAAPESLIARNNLATALGAQEKYVEAEAECRALQGLQLKFLPPDHPDTLDTRDNIINSLSGQDRQAEAELEGKALLAIRERTQGAVHPGTLGTVYNLALTSKLQGKLNQAHEYARRCMVSSRDSLPPEHRLVRLSADLHDEIVREVGERDLPRARGPSSVPSDSKNPDSANPTTVLAPDSDWKWLHPVDGKDPALSAPGFHNAFPRADFDDSQWRHGKDSDGPTGGFGYGLRFSGVDIGFPEDKAHRWSAYFRHAFTTDKVHRDLELSCQRDDGIIVYLDGKEVIRDNVGPGNEAYQLRAVEAVDEDDDSVVRRYPIPGELAPGPHVLAISVHNISPASTDLRLGGVRLVELEPPEKSR